MTDDSPNGPPNDPPNYPPPGFEPHFRKSPLTDPWEPLYSRRSGSGGDGAEEAGAGLTIGLLVGEAHCNSRGLAHGGLITALADNAMGLACALSGAGVSGLVTVTLTCDFISSAKIGDWLEIAAMPVRVGRTLAFASAEVTAAGRIVARASAVFNVAAPKAAMENRSE